MTPAVSPPGLYNWPVLVLDPGTHTAPIVRADVDLAGLIAVTGSHDGTVRVWCAQCGQLIHTIRLPQGPNGLGRVYAMAISRDGGMIAAGGWTRATNADPQEQIYLFDAGSGVLIHRIDRLSATVNHLAFAPDGRLAATVGKSVRIYDKECDWTEVLLEGNYQSSCYGAAFGRDGRLATTCWDGILRLYGPDGCLQRKAESGGVQPFGLAFDPDGNRLAVGFINAPTVRLFDAQTLDALTGPDTSGIDYGDLLTVAWSTDGATLFAGGAYDVHGTCPVIAWDGAGPGSRRALPAGNDTVSSLLPLPDGDLLVATGAPWLGRLTSDGTLRWSRASREFDARGQRNNLGLAEDGMVVDFGFEFKGKVRARLRTHNQKMTVAAMQMALMKVWAQRS